MSWTDRLFAVDWAALFVPDVSLLEIFVRGTVIYLALFFLLRFVLKREAAPVGITDLLVLVLIADAAQNAMAGDYRSITGGILLVATIAFWAYTLNWLGYRFPRLERLLHPPPLMLVRDGKLLYRNMRRELITRDELMSRLREEGVEDVAQVKMAYMEGDGQISVITREARTHRAGSNRKEAF